jgi:flagellar protein FlaG
MKTNVAPVSSIQDPGVPVARPVIGPDTIPPPPEAAHQNADLRLVIEEDQVSGTFIYKTLDRRTGEVVKQLPREEVVRLRDTPEYEPGDVIDALS